MESFLRQEFLPLLEEEGVEVLDIQETGHSGRMIFRIIVDRRDQELSIDDCVLLTKKLKSHLNTHALVGGDWRLEISSPGIGYPLSKPWQFRKNRGRLLRITLPGEKGPRDIHARLLAVQDEGIDVEMAGDREHFAYSEMLSARVLPEIGVFPKENRRR
jgi:ribosome maturation factor RimP